MFNEQIEVTVAACQDALLFWLKNRIAKGYNFDFESTKEAILNCLTLPELELLRMSLVNSL